MQNQLLETRPSIISLLDMQIDKTINIEEEAIETISSILEKANDIFLLLDRMQKARSTSDTQLLQISHALRTDLLKILEQFPSIFQNSVGFKNLEDCAGVEEIRLKGSKLAHRTRVFLKSFEAISNKFNAFQKEMIEKTRMRSWEDSSEE